MPLSPDSSPQALLHRLGYAGLLPFAGLSALLWLVRLDLHPFVATALLSYGAVVVSFLAGIHWGIAFQADGPPARFHTLWGVALSLLAWLAALMPAFAGLPLLGLLLAGSYAVDRKCWPAAGLGSWLTLRFRLTAVATLCCVLGAAAT
jgi:Protein of unknown function (DUF3429)